MTETLRLRCLRCGDWCEHSLWEACQIELCGPCNAKADAIILDAEDLDVGFARHDRWSARWQKAPASHPTKVALKAAWNAWEMDQSLREPF